MSNASRFIAAYNRIDGMLRRKYDLKSNLTYPDVIRRCVSLNPAVRRYEDDLLDYGRLRNAIVHKSDTDMVIAEPHLKTVELIEHICSLIQAPPKAAAVAKQAVLMRYDTPLIDAIKVMARSNISNLPVVKEGEIIGVASNKLIVEAFARNLEGSLEDYVRSASISSVLSGEREHYAIVKACIGVDEVLDMFTARRKLSIVILTSSGHPKSEITGVITTGDIMKMNEMLE